MTQVTNKHGIFYIMFELAFRRVLLGYILKIIQYNTTNLFQTPFYKVLRILHVLAD
jgi:hypothetical protein